LKSVLSDHIIFIAISGEQYNTHLGRS